jgi:hypothetical protein
MDGMVAAQIIAKEHCMQTTTAILQIRVYRVAPKTPHVHHSLIINPMYISYFHPMYPMHHLLIDIIINTTASYCTHDPCLIHRCSIDHGRVTIVASYSIINTDHH